MSVNKVIIHPLPAKEAAAKKAIHELRKRRLFSRLDAIRQNNGYPAIMASKVRINSS